MYIHISVIHAKCLQYLLKKQTQSNAYIVVSIIRAFYLNQLLVIHLYIVAEIHMFELVKDTFVVFISSFMLTHCQSEGN